MPVTIGNIRVDGLSDTLQQIERFEEAFIKRVDREIEASCLKIIRDMKARAPKNVGRLVQQITYKKKGPLNYELISGANYSAYLEFGTKLNVRIPAGYQYLASQFKGVNIPGGGKTMKEAIYDWAQQKGIDKKWWWWIYLKIQQQGIKPQPFFIPALGEFTLLENRIKIMLNQRTNG
jgi:HK97 gp10 family phage protein